MISGWWTICLPQWHIATVLCIVRVWQTMDWLYGFSIYNKLASLRMLVECAQSINTVLTISAALVCSHRQQTDHYSSHNIHANNTQHDWSNQVPDYQQYSNIWITSTTKETTSVYATIDDPSILPSTIHPTQLDHETTKCTIHNYRMFLRPVRNTVNFTARRYACRYCEVTNSMTTAD